MFARKWRDYDVGDAKTQLGGESLLGGGIAGVVSRIGVAAVVAQIAMITIRRQWTRLVLIGINCNAADIRRDVQAIIGVLVVVPRHRWDVVIRPAALVIAQEED